MAAPLATAAHRATLRDVVTDLKSYVKAHPTQALVGAAVVGFMAGRLLQRD